MIRTKIFGYEIKLDRKINKYRFVDNNELVELTHIDRPCGNCGKYRTEDGHDPCLSNLPGVTNACCGHGNKKESYVQFENGVVLRGFIETRK